MCMFKQNNFYIDGQIDYASVSAHYMATAIKSSPAWAYSLQSAISAVEAELSGKDLVHQL